MPELRLHTLPGLKIPPPYQLRFSDDDVLTLVAASSAKVAEAFEAASRGTPTVQAARSKAIAAFEGVHRELLDLLCEGLRASNGGEWFDFWNEADRLDTFHDLFDGLRALERKINELGGKLGYMSADETSQACGQHIEEQAPEIADQLAFIEQLINKSNRIANQIVRVPVGDEKQAQDSKFAADYNWAMSWALVGLNTIAIGIGTHGDVEVDVAPDVLGAALAAARNFALEAYHSVREGQRLRSDDEDEQPASEMAQPTSTEDEVADDSDLADVEEAISHEETRRGR